jgi:DNA-binding transcriptional LysR family regulator
MVQDWLDIGGFLPMVLRMMQHSLPDDRLFLRIMELGTLRAAAAEAGQEPSSISRRLNALERRLGTRLFDRSQGGSRPTEAGLRYYDRLRRIIGDYDALQADIAGEDAAPRGLLRVNAPIDLGAGFVARWLLDFQEQFPGVQTELILTPRALDLTASGMDIVLRVGDLPDSDLVARRLALVPRVLVAAPALLARHGVPQTPADLAALPHVFFQPENRARPMVLTGPDGTRHDIPRTGRVTVNAMAPLVQAVVRGHGLHLGPRWAFATALAAGELVEVMPGFTSPALPLTALRAPSPVVPARIRAFVDHMATAVRQVPGLTP